MHGFLLGTENNPFPGLLAIELVILVNYEIKGHIVKDTKAMLSPFLWFTNNCSCFASSSCQHSKKSPCNILFLSP